MSVPATQAQELVARYAALLNDPTHALDEKVLRGILAETNRMLANARPADRARLHGIRGAVCMRLTQFADALVEYKHARLLAPGNAYDLNNMAACMMEMGRTQEALDLLRDARALNPTRDLLVVIWANEAEARQRLGHQQTARESFEAAVRHANLDNPVEAFSLARVAAELGADHEAVEFFARYLALDQGVALGDEDAVDFVRRAPDALWARARALPVLHGALARVLAQDDDPAPEAMQVRNRIVLAPEAIEKLDGLLEHPPVPTDALRRLMQS